MMRRSCSRTSRDVICCVLAVLTVLLVGCSQSTNPRIDRFEGRYSGTWGTETETFGSWEATINAEGQVAGTGDDGDFDISGDVNVDGVMVFGATHRGTAVTAAFEGFIDEDGTVSGTWTEESSGEGGVFSGSRVDG